MLTKISLNLNFLTTKNAKATWLNGPRHLYENKPGAVVAAEKTNE